MKRILCVLTAIAISLCGAVPAYAAYETTIDTFECRGMTVPAYDGDPYEIVNDNETSFTDAEKASRQAYEIYTDLDDAGRVGTVTANIDQSSLPTKERGDISGIYPTGWVQNRYDTSIVSGGWLFNRSHLYAYSLGGEDEATNLCTGTRSFNVNGMFYSSESPVLDYVRANDVHVLYRVTPVFAGEELLPRGVLIEAETLENEDINICVFCYNVQPGIALDYMTGENLLASELTDPDEPGSPDDPDTPTDPADGPDKPVAMSSVKAGAIKTVVYTGKAQKPKVKLTDGNGSALTAGTDYTAAYRNNVKPGRATVTVKGIGKYSGTKTIRFYIKPKKMAFSSVKTAKRTMAVRWKKHAGVTGYQIAYKKKGASKYKVLNVKSTSVKKDIKKLKKGKIYQVKIRAYKKADGKTLYGAYSKIRTVKIR